MHESVELLEQRCLASPDLVRGLAVETFTPLATVLQGAKAIVVTGIGASEGPGRLLASCLAGPHRHVQFLPLSALMTGDHRPWTANSPDSHLVIFSQTLSPNARIALDAGQDFATTILICGPDVHVDAGKRFLVLRHPPARETGFLVRVTGPAVASAMALALAELVTRPSAHDDVRRQLQHCADAMEKRLRNKAPDVDFVANPPAFLVYGADGGERNHLLRWTLLECLDKHDPSIFDLLSFAHGAFQNIFDASRTLILLRSSADTAMALLVDRLGDMLGQTRHTLLDVASELRRPWCLLEHLAVVQALMLEHLRKNPRDLRAWPGRGHDGALFDLEGLPPSASRW